MAYNPTSPADNRATTARRPDANSGKEPLSPEYQTWFTNAAQDACAYVDEELSPLRATATQYYLGEPFGNEVDGRSQIVLSVVRDAILGVLPDVMRVFFGPEHTVEFMPNKKETVEQAAQMTDYARYVFEQDNNGFGVLHSVLKDGLVKKMGIVKWWWDESKTKKSRRLRNVTEAQLQALGEEDDVDLVSVSDEPKKEPTTFLDKVKAKLGIQPEKTYSVLATWTNEDGSICVEAVPPEEWVVSREARDVQKALFVGHRRDLPKSDLIAMGYDEDMVNQYGGLEGSDLENQIEEIERRRVIDATPAQDPPTGDEMVKVPYMEGYFRGDYDGDGLAELNLVCAIGPSWTILTKDGKDCIYPVDEAPFAVFCPDPEPHTIAGMSWADRLMDKQFWQSMVARGMNDSLALSITPRSAAVTGKVNLTDLANNEIGAMIRVTDIGALQEFKHSFVGADALSVINYIDQVIERATGRSNGAAGLSMDSLQSTNQDVGRAAIDSNMAQSEMLCRLMASQVMVPMFKGIAKLANQYQPSERVIKLRGAWVPMNPAVWDTDCDMQVNVALGSGMAEKKIATLMATAGKQQEILTQLGPANPLVGLGQLRYTFGKILEMQGLKDTENYFKPLPVDYQPPPAPPQQPQQSPEDVIAQAQLAIQHEKNQKDVLLKQADLQQKEDQSQRDYAFKVWQATQDVALRMEQIAAQFKVNINQQTIDAASDTAKQNLDAQSTQTDQALAIRAQAHDEAVAAQQAQMQQQAPSPQPEPGETGA